MCCSTIVTGGNAGPGFEAARDFAADQSTLIVVDWRDLALEEHAVEHRDAMACNATLRTFQMLESAKVI
jgi:NAD(P)-dependent dehydrogenase (short-subunit alcohol dehydrogenase family)